MVASVHGFRLEFYVNEVDNDAVKADILADLKTLKDANKIMRTNGNINEITTPESIFQYVITFDTDDGHREEVKTAVRNKISMLLSTGKIFNPTGRIEERLEFQIENLTF